MCRRPNFKKLKFEFTGIQVFWFPGPNNNSIVKITINNKIVEKQKYHVANEKSCVSLVKISVSITGFLTSY